MLLVVAGYSLWQLANPPPGWILFSALHKFYALFEVTNRVKILLKFEPVTTTEISAHTTGVSTNCIKDALSSRQAHRASFSGLSCWPMHEEPLKDLSR